ncbi:MAG: triose-phosphate isomerase [Candidatus Margulisiibacteriota bacterium]
MRRPLIVGNWKMYKTLTEAVEFVHALKSQVAEVLDRDLVVCPPFPALEAVANILKGSNLKVGAQNLFWEDEGAFTGEVSAPMLKAVGCEYVIIGHSERRQYFWETDPVINKKVFAALKHGLRPIVCVGETSEQRKRDQTFRTIESQIYDGLKDLTIDQWPLVAIAYEPVWAIGTGKTATPQQAQEVQSFIRKLLPQEVAQIVRILYGGSIKPENIKELMAQPDIDGGLVGGASLSLDSFVKIVKY